MPARKRSPGFTFSARTGRYYNERTGRFVGRPEVRRVVEAIVQRSARRVDALAAQLRTGAISIDQWEIAMRREIKATHLISTMIAKGGRAQMTQADFGAVGTTLAGEYRFLQRFADQVVAGEAPIDGRFTRRSQSYVKDARETFYDVSREEERGRGFTLEQNVHRPGENCEECLAESAKGKVPIGTLKAIGRRTCGNNCNCEIHFFRD